MATLRALHKSSTGDWSMSHGIRSYILCCFPSSNRSSSDTNSASPAKQTTANGKVITDDYDVVDSAEVGPRANGHTVHDTTTEEHVHVTLTTDADHSQSYGTIKVIDPATHNHVDSSSDDESEVYQSRNEVKVNGSINGDVPLAGGGGQKRGSVLSLETTLPDDPRLFDPNKELQGMGLDERPPSVSRFGSIQASIVYDHEKGCLVLTVIRVTEVPTKDRGGSDSTRVHVVLLASRKKFREKTRIRAGDSPEFDETYRFKIAADAVPTSAVRLRLYGCERMKRERLISETLIRGGDMDLVTGTTHWYNLKPRSEMTIEERGTGDDTGSLTKSESGGSASSVNSLQGGAPEILLGLAYSSLSGRLQVEVIKGSNFRSVGSGRLPDTYVKVQLLSFNGQEITRTKTSTRRGQPNPVFKESFLFQVPAFQLADVTLTVSVFNKRTMKRKELMGWCSLGHSNSGEEESSHWNEMKNNRGQHVNRWHTLVDS